MRAVLTCRLIILLFARERTKECAFIFCALTSLNFRHRHPIPYRSHRPRIHRCRQHRGGDGREEKDGRQEPCIQEGVERDNKREGPCKEEEEERDKREEPCKEQVQVMEVCVQ